VGIFDFWSWQKVMAMGLWLKLSACWLPRDWDHSGPRWAEDMVPLNYDLESWNWCRAFTPVELDLICVAFMTLIVAFSQRSLWTLALIHRRECWCSVLQALERLCVHEPLPIAQMLASFVSLVQSWCRDTLERFVCSLFVCHSCILWDFAMFS